ncbi:MAG TPA: hypothetical protein DCW90_06255 [Lachnospiraceae bacterium]|nr:amidoligase family protein [uncultured Lachnoclostridium sp.]HAU85100.1 hypothetical protein [Lachnospiraceae bacterium]
MRITKRFEIGSQHLMAKGTLKVKSYFEENDILYMVYTLNEDPTEYTNKYVNVISIIYKWQKKNGITSATTVEEFVELTLTRSLKFGLEMELTVPSKELLRTKLIEAGVRVSNPSSTHEVVVGWKLVYDGSIQTSRGYEGVELVAPPSTNFDELEIVCKVLNEIGAKVNNSCGLHVHHEIADFKRQQILRMYNFYSKYEEVINSFMPASRLNNRYCQPVSRIIDKVNNCPTKEKLLKDIAGKGARGYYDSCRYYTMNLRSYLYYGTIEFRQHAGSTNFEEISNWILFTHKILERGLEIGNNVQPLDSSITTKKAKYEELKKELKIERTKLAKHFENRLKKARVA